MEAWETYRPEDFLLFSERTYWRLFALENEATWPLPLAMLWIGLATVWLVWRARRSGDPVAALSLALMWAWAGWSFLRLRYAPVNWAAGYAVVPFLAEAAALALAGLLGGLRFGVPEGLRKASGGALLVWGVALHPLLALAGPQGLKGAEVAGIAPDPTAIATLGALVWARGRWTGALAVLPILWLGFSGAVLLVMDAWQGWVPLGAIAVAGVGFLGKR